MPDWFRRRSTHTDNGTSTSGAAAAAPDATPVALLDAASAVPEGAFTKCQKCSAILYTKDFERDLKVCAKCGHHHRLSAGERVEYTVDEGSFAETNADLIAVDPLAFPDYAEKLAKGRRSSGHLDSLLTGTAAVGGQPCVLAVADFAFMGGSMGSVFGEKFARATDLAIEEKLPLVVFCASGGARMQEGLFSLMQMAKTSAAVAQLAEEKIPYVVVLTDPTTGGALASFASLGDVILSEPGAYVAFAGTRVAQQAAQNQKLPPNYQLAEFQEEHGMIDRIIPRRELPVTLARTLAFFGVGTVTTAEGSDRTLPQTPGEIVSSNRNGSQ
ncbi:MAG: acetyl-CoA carboxylase, carboxyltransferase subunit beta [Cytophagales bacterium]|nr:acetyl-CoA carboxylase, carboxyltransferase subunit beta [Armatimonadota bacterium]